MNTSTRFDIIMLTWHNRLKIKQILVLMFFVLASSNALGQPFNTTESGSWSSVTTWTGGNRPGNPVSVGTTNVRHTVNVGARLTLGSSNHGNLIVRNTGRLTLEAGLRVTENHWDIIVESGGILLIHGNIEFLAGTGQGNMPDLIIRGDVRVSGTITGTGTIAGNGRLFVNPGSIGPNIQWASGTGGWSGQVVYTPDPLPIELNSFSAEAADHSIELKWETATETNNDFFTIERSPDVQNWEIIGYVDGAGNSNRPLSYSFTDSQPLDGISYYRLKQTDYDGKYEYFGPVAVQFNSETKSLSFKVNRQFDHWVIVLPGKGLHHVEVYNLQGHRLINQPAENNLTIPVQRGPVVIRVVDQNSRIASQVVQ